MKAYFQFLKHPPGQSRSQNLVDSVISASAELLQEFGYEEFTVEKVAKRSGVGIGSLYQYFSSKKDIVLVTLVALAEIIVNEILEKQLSKIEQIEDPKMAIDYIVESGLKSLLQNPKRINNLYSLVITFGLQSSMIQFRELYRKEMVESLRRYIKPGIDESKIQLVSYVIVNSLLGINVAYMNKYTSSSSVEKVIEEAKDLAWLYLSPYLVSQKSAG